MTFKDIITAIENNKRVFWSNKGYEVIKDVVKQAKKDDVIQYLIHCNINDSYAGLLEKNGEIVAYNPNDFFIG